MSIENIKELSPALTELLEKLKSNILSTRKIFDQFVTQARKEEFTDQDIDLLVSHHLKGIIPKSSLIYYKKEYLSLPNKVQFGQNDDKNVMEQSSNDPLENIPEERTRTIPTAYDIKEAESTPSTEPEAYFGSAGLQDSDELLKVQNQNNEEPSTEIPPYIQIQLQERETLKQHNKELLTKIEQLETKLSDKTFDEIRNTSKDSIKTGIYDLEIKDKIIPLKWNYAPTINRMVIELDVNRARRMGI